jgi:hypothetical protein
LVSIVVPAAVVQAQCTSPLLLAIGERPSLPPLIALLALAPNSATILPFVTVTLSTYLPLMEVAVVAMPAEVLLVGQRP